MAVSNFPDLEISRRKDVELLVAAAENRKSAADIREFLRKGNYPENISSNAVREFLRKKFCQNDADVMLKVLTSGELELLYAFAENKKSVADVQKFLRKNYPEEYSKLKKA
jgi:hypothetical protein